MNFFCKLPFIEGVQPPELISMKFLLLLNLLKISFLTFGKTLLDVILPTKEHSIFFSVKPFFCIEINLFSTSSYINGIGTLPLQAPYIIVFLGNFKRGPSSY